MTTLPAKVLLLGSGELGKEVAIAAQRLGCHVVACDRYANAPAMQVADEAEVLAMTFCFYIITIHLKSTFAVYLLPHFLTLKTHQ